MDTLDHQNPPPPTPSSTLDPPGAGASRAKRDIVPSNPRVLIMKGLDTDLGKLSPFQRKHACDRLGKVVRCDRLRDGALEIEFTDSREAQRALSVHEISFYKRVNGDRKVISAKVVCTPHETKNFSKGVIRCFELKGVDECEIVDGLSDSGVVEARRIKSKKGLDTVETDTIVLTFDSHELPETIFVGYVRVAVRPFIPSPMRCFRCQRYGHTSSSCKGAQVCGRCSSTDHNGDGCTAEKFCVNCGEGQTPHTAYDRNCPVLEKEKEIMSIKVKGRMSFREARDAYNAKHPQKTYAQATSDGVRSPPRMTPEEVIRSLTVADLVRLAGKMGLVFAHQPSAPAPEPVAGPPPAPPSQGDQGREPGVTPAPLTPRPAPAGGGDRGGGHPPPPTPDPQPGSPSGDLEPEICATPISGPDPRADSEGYILIGRGGKPAPGGRRRPPSPIVPPNESAAAALPEPPPPPLLSAPSVATMRKNFEATREVAGARGRSPTKRPAAGTPPDMPQASRPRARGSSQEVGRGGSANRPKPNPTGTGAGRKNVGASSAPWKG